MKINGKPDGGGGGGVITSLSISANGIYIAEGGVDGYNPVEVDVPEQKPEETFNVTPSTTEQTITPQEGYVFTSGVVGAVTSNIDANIQAGNIKSGVTILGVEGNYTAPAPVTESLSVSVNGTYTPGQGVDGFSQVVVDVPQSVAGFTEKEITEETYAIYNLSNSASFVHRNVFEGDVNLLTVNLPNASYVGSEAFKFCTNLTSVDMATCEVIYEYAFENCTSLVNVSLPNCKTINISAFKQCSIISLNLPNCISIQNNAFQNNFYLTTVSLPKIVGLWPNVFLNCSSLNSVYINECNILYNEVFRNCGNLSYLSIPNCIEIRNQVFLNCTSLKDVYVGLDYYGVTTLQNVNVFQNTPISTSDGKIYVNADIYDKYIVANNWSNYASHIVSVVNPAGTLLSYSNGVLNGNTSYVYSNIYSLFNFSKTDLTEVNLPECVTIYSAAFSECKYLSVVSLPKCSYIMDYGFGWIGSSATNYFDLVLPVCQYIGAYGFVYATKLSTITLGSNSVCTLYVSNAFNGIANTLASIYVPASLVDAYKAAPNWSYFASKIQAIPEP